MVKQLDEISSRFFLIGFLSSKIKLLPFIPLTVIINLISLAAYLIGYTAWFFASFFYTNPPSPSKHWYDFLTLPAQYRLSAGLGVLATCFCLFVPSVLVAALWMYVVSNVLWGLAEYRKKQTPPDDKYYSDARQTIYLHYVKLIICSSFVMAITPIIIWLAPAITVPVTITAAVIMHLLTLISLYYLRQAATVSIPAETHPSAPQSYIQLTEKLNLHPKHSPKPSPSPAPIPKSPPHTSLSFFCPNSAANTDNMQLDCAKILKVAYTGNGR